MGRTFPEKNLKSAWRIGAEVIMEKPYMKAQEFEDTVYSRMEKEGIHIVDANKTPPVLVEKEWIGRMRRSWKENGTSFEEILKNNFGDMNFTKGDRGDARRKRLNGEAVDVKKFNAINHSKGDILDSLLTDPTVAKVLEMKMDKDLKKEIISKMIR